MTKMLKQFEETQKEMAKIYAVNLTLIKKADEIAKKAMEFLPKEWGSGFVLGWDGLLISKNDSTDTFEFRNVCNIIEKIIGQKMVRSPWMMTDSKDKEYLFCLYGKAFIPMEDEPKGALRVEVRMFTPYGKEHECILEYEDKVVKVAKIDPGCLGNHRESTK